MTESSRRRKEAVAALRVHAPLLRMWHLIAKPGEPLPVGIGQNPGAIRRLDEKIIPPFRVVRTVESLETLAVAVEFGVPEALEKELGELRIARDELRNVVAESGGGEPSKFDLDYRGKRCANRSEALLCVADDCIDAEVRANVLADTKADAEDPAGSRRLKLYSQLRELLYQFSWNGLVDWGRADPGSSDVDSSGELAPKVEASAPTADLCSLDDVRKAVAIEVEPLKVQAEEARTATAASRGRDARGSKPHNGAIDKACALVQGAIEQEKTPFETIEELSRVAKCHPTTLRGSSRFMEKWRNYETYVRLAKVEKLDREVERELRDPE